MISTLPIEGEFVHQQQALVLQVRVGPGRFLGIEVDQLAEEQVDDQPARQLVRLDADVDGHLLLADVGQQEIVAAGGLVQHRVDPGFSGSLKVPRIEAKVSACDSMLAKAERALALRKRSDRVLRYFFRSVPSPGTTGTPRRAWAWRPGNRCCSSSQFSEQVQGEGHERVARLADPELLVLGPIRIQHRSDAHQVRDAERRIVGDG